MKKSKTHIAIFTIGLTLLAWIVTLIATHHNNLPADGHLLMGWPGRFLDIYLNQVQGGYLWKWNFGGGCWNLLFWLFFGGLVFWVATIVLGKETPGNT